MAILIRPVREQFEHDRVIRELELKLRRRYGVEANVGDERHTPVKAGGINLYPDLVLTRDEGRKPHAIVEVETSESVNHLEAMGQWVRYAKARAAFHLYVPAAAVDSALRLCKKFRIAPAEVWAFLPLGDQFRFTQILPTAGLVEPDLDIARIRADRRAAEELAEAALALAAEVDDGETSAGEGVAAEVARPAKGSGKVAVASQKSTPARQAAVRQSTSSPGGGRKSPRAASVSAKSNEVRSGGSVGAAVKQAAPTKAKGSSGTKLPVTASKSRTAGAPAAKPARPPASGAGAKVQGAARSATPVRSVKPAARATAAGKGGGTAKSGPSRKGVAPASAKATRRAGQQASSSPTRRVSTTTSTRKPSAAKAPARSAPARPVASTGRSATRTTAKARGTQKRR